MVTAQIMLFTMSPFGTLVNFNGSNNGHGLKNVICKQTFSKWV